MAVAQPLRFSFLKRLALNMYAGLRPKTKWRLVSGYIKSKGDEELIK
jgi:hypothetical protein